LELGLVAIRRKLKGDGGVSGVSAIGLPPSGFVGLLTFLVNEGSSGGLEAARKLFEGEAVGLFIFESDVLAALGSCLVDRTLEVE